MRTAGQPQPGEQRLDGVRTDQGFAEPPDRRFVGRVVVIVETQEAAEAASSENLELGLRIRLPVERLRRQRLEHHRRIQRRPAALAAVRALQRRRRPPRWNQKMLQFWQLSL